jgi:hypothetical protein
MFAVTVHRFSDKVSGVLKNSLHEDPNEPLPIRLKMCYS